MWSNAYRKKQQCGDNPGKILIQNGHFVEDIWTYVVRAQECTVYTTSHRRTLSVLRQDDQVIESRCSKDVSKLFVSSPVTAELQDGDESDRHFKHHSKSVAACYGNLSSAVRTIYSKVASRLTKIIFLSRYSLQVGVVNLCTE